MLDTTSLSEFENQFDNLLAVIDESNLRVVSEPPDDLFSTHLNVFIKSYVVSACSILEAFIQDLACLYLDKLKENAVHANLPLNLILWSIVKDDKLKGKCFTAFQFEKTRKDISDMISGNIFVTIKAFEKLGIDLEKHDAFNGCKDFISTTIIKRNDIVHHNDNASDLSLMDVKNIVEKFKEYIAILEHAVCVTPHLLRVEN